MKRMAMTALIMLIVIMWAYDFAAGNWVGVGGWSISMSCGIWTMILMDKERSR